MSEIQLSADAKRAAEKMALKMTEKMLDVMLDGMKQSIDSVHNSIAITQGIQIRIATEQMDQVKKAANKK